MSINFNRGCGKYEKDLLSWIRMSGFGQTFVELSSFFAQRMLVQKLVEKMIGKKGRTSFWRCPSLASRIRLCFLRLSSQDAVYEKLS